MAWLGKWQEDSRHLTSHNNNNWDRISPVASYLKLQTKHKCDTINWSLSLFGQLGNLLILLAFRFRNDRIWIVAVVVINISVFSPIAFDNNRWWDRQLLPTIRIQKYCLDSHKRAITMPQCRCRAVTRSHVAFCLAFKYSVNYFFFIWFEYKFIQINRYHNWMKELKSIQKCDIRHKIPCEMNANQCDRVSGISCRSFDRMSLMLSNEFINNYIE